MRKKAQIKLGESIAILVIFFFLLVFGFSFYAKFQKEDTEKKLDEISDLNSIELIQKTMFISEIQCTVKNIPKDNCFDLMKLKAMRDLISSDSEALKYYYDIFGSSSIVVETIYPEGKESIHLYDNVLEGESIRRTRMAVSLYDAVEKKYMFGVVHINMTG